MKTVLVLGGNGYLGSKVEQALLANGYKVISIIRKSSNGNNPKITYYNNDNDSILSVFDNNNIDKIINMACSYDHGISLYQDVIESNINFPLRVMNAAAQANVHDFITIGTGLPDNFNMYSVSKKCFSDFGRLYSEKHGMNFTNIKLEMFYGDDEPKDRFIAYVADKLLKNEDIDLTLGYQKRDIIHVDDVTNIIVNILEKEWNGFNEIPVGTGEAPTIREIVTFMKEISKSSSHLNWGNIPMRRGIEPDCKADITIISNNNMKIMYQWQDGIRKMLDDIREKG